MTFLPTADDALAIPEPFAKSLENRALESPRAKTAFGLPLIELASNENALGPSPAVLGLIGALGPRVARYPDPGGHELRDALARKHGASPEQVVLGNGSSEILELVARAFLTRGTSAVYSQYAFIVYPVVTSAAGATGITAPASAFGNDPQALLDAIREDTRVLFLANPNNPTGTLLDRGEILDLIARVPRDVIVVLDEAYYEYLPIESAPPSVAWLDEFPNLLIARTFSKAYGLAGLRVGFALCHRRVADSLNAIRQPFNVNTFAQSTALAALGDNEHLARSVAMARSSILQLTRGFAEQGIDFIPSNANFVTFRPGDTKRVHRGLADQGILVRDLENYGMPDYLRVSAGLPAENARFLLALAGVLPDTGSKS